MESEHDSVDERLPVNLNIEETDNIVNPMEPPAERPDLQADGSSENGQTLTAKTVPGNMTGSSFVYRQDVVSCSKHEGLLGVVMEVAGDSDSDGSITDDSDSEGEGEEHVGDPGDSEAKGDDKNYTDGDDENDSLPDGQVRIVWTDGAETTDNIGDITVVDRGFLHGDIVASAADPTGQLGLVVDVNITVDLLASNGEVIKQVSSKDLKRIREFTVGDYVVRGPWLGRVDDVLDNVTILFDDGSVCKVVRADPLRLQPVSKPVIDDANCPYYPGQRIRAVSSSVFKSSRWLSGLWKPTRLEGTVIKVQTASVIVYWVASAYFGIGANSSNVPAEEQSPKDLNLLDCFSYANWQLGDWCLLPPSSNGNGTSNSGNLKRHIEDPQIRHSDQSSVDQETTDIVIKRELTDDSISSCAENSGQDLHTTDIVDNCHQLLEPSNTITDVNETEYDSHDLQLHSGSISDGQNGNATFEEPRCSDLMDSHGTVKPGASNMPESNGISHGCGSSAPKEAAHESWPSYRRKLRKVLFKRDKKTRRRDENFERALFIMKTVTKVDVAWQDGKREYGLDSISLIPIQTPNDHEFFPEQYVVEKASDEGNDYSETKRIGIVRSLNAKEKTVCVRWLKPVSRPEDAREFDFEEVVSAYELDEHPDYDYCYGDVVVRLSPVSVAPSTTNLASNTVGDIKQSDMMESEGDRSEDQSTHDHGDMLMKDEAHEDFTCLTWVGNITGLQDGDIEVTWADGMVSKVGPQAIYVVGRDDDGDSFGGGSEISDDGASWETVDENDLNALVNVEKEADLRNVTDNDPDVENSVPSPPDEDSNFERNGPLSMPLAALGYVTRLATGLFSRGRKQTDLDDSVSNRAESQETSEASDRDASGGELGNITTVACDGQDSQEGLEITYGFGNGEEVKDTEMIAGTDTESSIPVAMNVDSRGDDNHYSFKHFDITENPVDHYFLESSAQGGGGKKWVKKVQQEWSILEKNLPDAIFVRVFEDRMDLLRAVIIGASGTPYQDGLFFFDFYLPPEYPQVPPSAYYHSGGLRVNPNLYVDGKVCLSLLNTWTGKGNEVWDPSSSSILQVLVSLQGLVLNSKPYFNEAGYEKQVGTIEGEKNSLPYNENTYLLNLKSMMYLLRRPPMHFEGFVKDHFQRRGWYILKACETYMGDSMIGSLTKDACRTEKSKEHSCSVGFKLMLTKILPRLISALKEAGVDCHQFEYLQNSENPPRN